MRKRADASACRPHPIPGSDSQGNSDLRKITRNLSLTFATFGDTGQRLSCPTQDGAVQDILVERSDNVSGSVTKCQ